MISYISQIRHLRLGRLRLDSLFVARSELKAYSLISKSLLLTTTVYQCLKAFSSGQIYDHNTSEIDKGNVMMMMAWERYDTGHF